MNLRILKKITSLLEKYYKYKQTSRPDVQHKYASFSIMLPSAHLLPFYQQRYKHYDKFLPHFVRYLSNGDLVVDVGANCGDSMASMFDANQSLEFVCIEADDFFFNYLQRNVSTINAYFKDAQINVVKSLVGKNVTNVELKGHGGTKHSVVCEGTGLKSRTLDDILANNLTTVRLLKSDVDGFDYDVIDSANHLITTQQPIIFFECQINDISQKNGFEHTIKEINAFGYKEWWVFDNFGNFLLNTSDIRQLYQLIDYVWSQNTEFAFPTIFYLDILTCTQKDEIVVSNAISQYY